MKILETIKKSFMRKNIIDIEKEAKRLAKKQEEIDKLYETEGLSDRVLNKQVKLNQLRNKLDISDRKNRIYDRFVQ